MDDAFFGLRVALAHHWLVGMRGGEKVLEQISLLSPKAPIFTLVANAANLSEQLQQHPMVTSWLQQTGGARHYKKLLPLFPAAVSRLRVPDNIDVLFSSDASVIKGLSCPERTLHFCYCHSPPRYLWDRQEDYERSAEAGGAAGRALFKIVAPYVREFDRRAAQRVTGFIANSNFVRDRIRACYDRDSEVIFPPVYLKDFQPLAEPPGDFYLIVSQLVPYKRIDVAVAAFTKLKRKLVVIGEGSESRRLQSMAGATITFLGSQPASVLREHFRRCRAFIFPGVEDFGITPLEAQASGRPVIAYRAGGALETVVEGVTGIFFDTQTPESLEAAVRSFEAAAKLFDPAACRRNAEKFSPERFRMRLREYLASALGKKPESKTSAFDKAQRTAALLPPR